MFPFFVKGSNRRKYADAQLYTASAEQDLPLNIRSAASGANPAFYIIARRDSDAMAAFGWSASAYRIGGENASWGGASVLSVVSEVTSNTGYPAVNITTDSPWNDVAHDGDGHVIFGIAPQKAEVLTWTGDGTVGQAVGHGLGDFVGASFITAFNITRDNYIYHSQRPMYLWQTGTGWVDQSGTNVMGSTTSTITARGNLNTSGVSYNAVVIPGHTGVGSDDHIACGLTAGVSTATGWQPRALLWIDVAGNVRWWIDKRDDGAGDVSSDLSTELSGTSGVNVNSLVTPTASGFTGNVGYYMAFR